MESIDRYCPPRGGKLRALVLILASNAVLAGAAQAGEVCSGTFPLGSEPTATGTSSFACGTVATTGTGEQATAVGNGAQASGDSNTAFGFNSQAVFGENATAIGRNAIASDDMATSVGGSLFFTQGPTSFFATTQASAFGTSALGAGATSSGEWATALGAAARATGDSSIAAGSWYDRNGDGLFSFTETSTAAGAGASAFGAGSQAAGINSVALGSGSTANADGSVALGNGAVADRANTVSVGATGSERQIVNVAAGTQATDAVNLSQLQATLATANAYTDTAVATGGTAANAYTDNREAAIRSDMEAGDDATLSAANSYTDARIAALPAFDAAPINRRLDAVERRLGQQDKRISRTGAMAAAYAGVAVNTSGLGGPNRIGIGLGGQEGEEALAVGYQRAVGSRSSFSLGAAFSGSESSVSAGAGFSW